MTMDRKKIGICMCRMCPSFVDCEEEIAFCLASTGKSACIKKEKGCLCPACPGPEAEGFPCLLLPQRIRNRPAAS